MPRGRAMLFLICIVAMNGLVCIGGAAMVVFDSDGARAVVGNTVYGAAVVALLLTPLQVAAVWIIIAPRLQDQRARRRIQVRVARLLESGQVDTVFQPIFDLGSGRVVGAEALSRFRAYPEVPPDVWFAQAEQVGCGLELEIVAVEAAIENAAALPEHLYIAINVSAATLVSERLVTTLRAGPIPMQRIVLELTEHASIDDYAPVREARERLRESGLRVAVDDAGAGHSSMRHIVALAPEIIKIDKSLVIGVDADVARRALVAAVVLFALESGATVLAEGVESECVLTTLVRLGVESAQGYFLGRPSNSPEVYASWNDAVCPHRALDDSQLYALRPPTNRPTD